MTGLTERVGTTEAVRACQQELPAQFDGGRLAFGFDGILDNVRTMVDTRHGPGESDRLERLADLRDRLDESVVAESSLTVEWERVGARTGGHACHLARAFNTLGADTTMVGTYGQPVRERFETEFEASSLVSIGAPGVCEAVEFDDGKLLLPETGDAARLDWDLLTDRIDVGDLADHLDGQDVLGVGYWNVTSLLPNLLATLVAETWPVQASPPERVLFDTGDIRMLPADRIRDGAAALAEVDETVPVTVSANRPETAAIAATAVESATASHRTDAEAAFDVLGVDQFVGHGVSQSVALSGSRTVTVDVPKTDSPAMTTSAGDHFNVGFALGLLEGLSLPATTVLGNALAGVFVRTGRPPEYEEIAAFVDDYAAKL
jgi:sugar/nucleoside kinase (ribokinase family)